MRVTDVVTSMVGFEVRQRIRSIVTLFIMKNRGTRDEEVMGRRNREKYQ